MVLAIYNTEAPTHVTNMLHISKTQIILFNGQQKGGKELLKRGKEMYKLQFRHEEFRDQTKKNPVSSTGKF